MAGSQGFKGKKSGLVRRDDRHQLKGCIGESSRMKRSEGQESRSQDKEERGDGSALSHGRATSDKGNRGQGEHTGEVGEDGRTNGRTDGRTDRTGMGSRRTGTDRIGADGRTETDGTGRDGRRRREDCQRIEGAY